MLKAEIENKEGNSYNLKLAEMKINIETNKNLEGKVSDNKILFLSALKAEDEIYDFTNKSKSSLKEVENIYKKQVEKINNFNQEIIVLKDKINELNAKNNELQNLNSKAFDELDLIEKQLNDLTNKIISQNNNYD